MRFFGIFCRLNERARWNSNYFFNFFFQWVSNLSRNGHKLIKSHENYYFSLYSTIYKVVVTKKCDFRAFFSVWASVHAGISIFFQNFFFSLDSKFYEEWALNIQKFWKLKIRWLQSLLFLKKRNFCAFSSVWASVHAGILIFLQFFFFH